MPKLSALIIIKYMRPFSTRTHIRIGSCCHLQYLILENIKRYTAKIRLIILVYHYLCCCFCWFHIIWATWYYISMIDLIPIDAGSMVELFVPYSIHWQYGSNNMSKISLVFLKPSLLMTNSDLNILCRANSKKRSAWWVQSFKSCSCGVDQFISFTYLCAKKKQQR